MGKIVFFLLNMGTPQLIFTTQENSFFILAKTGHVRTLNAHVVHIHIMMALQHFDLPMLAMAL